ncbi:MAG: hypothetical protein JWR10_2768 [Rubritepida sp.]|nr:hypothetical protein [Rubritepida sp.]
MADYNEQVVLLWEEWSSETRQVSGNPDDFIDWATARRRLAPRPQDIKQLLRKQVTHALRQARRLDEVSGFTYRAKQSVTLFENDIAIKHYFDTDRGGTPSLRQKSVRQRREAIAHHVYRAVCDVDRMNKVFPEDPQLNFFKDFTDDVAELRMAEIAGTDDNSEAA